MTFAVGLTGGIASGKSLAGAHFAELGAPVLDADQLARDVVTPGSPSLLQLIEHFGRGILDPEGAMDRRRMRERVFADPQARQELEAMLHPLIHQRILQWKKDSAAPYCVIMIPLLAKMGWQNLVDRVLVIDCTEEDQLERLAARDDIDEALARSMIAAQDTRRQRQDAADDLILNTGSMAALRGMVEQCHDAYLAYAQDRTAVLQALWLPE